MEVMEDMEAIGKLLSEKELFFGSLSAESGGLCMYLERSVLKVQAPSLRSFDERHTL
jgi:hypothetical protein